VRVRLRSLADYQQNPENPVSHTPHNLSTVVESIHKVGAARSGLAADGTIYAGNLTSEAMALAGIEGIVEVTTDGTKWVMVNRPDLTPEQRKQAAHGDQWSAMLAEMNVDQLLADIEAGINLDGIYSEFDLEAILGEALGEAETGEAPEPKLGKGVELAEKYDVSVGQIWQLDKHRLAVGDCREQVVVDAVMQDEKAGMSFVDPPYNVIAESGQSRSEKRIESDDVVTQMLESFIEDSVQTESTALGNGACVYTCTDFRHLHNIIKVREQYGYKTKGCIVWVKPHFGMGSWYRRQYELILFSIYGKRSPDNWPHDKGDVWQFEIEDRINREHASQKPLSLVQSAIEDATKLGDTVIDFFVGSGTTLIVCERLDRICRAIDISPTYCAVTIQRWVDLTGKEPKLLQ
jgi:DNA modification methylase